MVTVEVDSKALLAALDNLGKQTAPALVAALNKAAATTKTEAGRSIRQEINLGASAVNKSLSIKRANRGDLSAAITIAGKQVPLIAFTGTRQTRKGVSVKPLKTGSRSVIPHTFIATMNSGHRGVWWRGKGAGRLPINELFSVAVQQVLKTKQLGHLIVLVKHRIEVELRNQIAFRTKRAQG